jgi:hypothetical protein
MSRRDVLSEIALICRCPAGAFLAANLPALCRRWRHTECNSNLLVLSVFRFPSTLSSCPAPATPAPKINTEVDLNFFFHQVPASCGFLAEPVWTRLP